MSRERERREEEEKKERRGGGEKGKEGKRGGRREEGERSCAPQARTKASKGWSKDERSEFRERSDLCAAA